MNSLLDVRDLNVSFRMYDSALGQRELRVISDLSLEVSAGEIVAVAGSSGSGKSLLAHAVMGLLPPNATATGEMLYRGERLTQRRQAALRGRAMALIPQSVAYFDPLMRIGAQVAGIGRRDTLRDKVFARLGLRREAARLYPFQMSGGMARRALVATAIVAEADLIIADEPTPGMDLPHALEALRCFREFADEGKGVVLITHDVDLAANIANRLAVFYAGTTVEVAPCADFLAGKEALRHPYTRALWDALPQNGFEPIAGAQPYAGDLPPGCLFAPRCGRADGRCRERVPAMRAVRGGTARCFYAT